MISEREEQYHTICCFIQQFIETYGWPPSRREIAAALGFKSTSHVAYCLAALEQQGYLLCQPHISRGLVLTPAGHALAEHALAAGQEMASLRNQ